MIEEIYNELSKIAKEEYADIIVLIENPHGKLRLHIIDESYLDIWFSRKIPGRYAYHWERRHINGTIYRHNNRPHQELKHMKTYPKHFHNGKDENVKESHISNNPKTALRQILETIRQKIRKQFKIKNLRENIEVNENEVIKLREKEKKRIEIQS